MRKIEAQMINAVRDCLNGSESSWKSGNTAVYVQHRGFKHEFGYERIVVVEFHGNVIAEFDSALCGHRDSCGLKLSDCGWRTPTTKSRLNALLMAFTEGSEIYQKQGQWFSPYGEK